MRRRTRYTASVLRPRTGEAQELDILAYSREGAIALAAERGYTIMSIETAAAKAQRERGGGYRIDRAALREALDFLGIALPVKIRYTSRVGRTRGNHRLVANRSHDIMLKSYLPADQASKTLWHELAHAMQSERAIRAGQDWLAIANERNPGSSRRIAYRVRPIEVEARTYEQYAEACPLAVPR